jgi:hypothetical protein
LRRQARDRAFVEQKQKLATANHLLAVAPAPAGRDSRAGPVLFPAGSPCGREAPVRKTMRDCLRTPDCEQLLVRRGVVRSAELRSNRARFAAVPGAERDARATPSSCAARARAQGAAPFSGSEPAAGEAEVILRPPGQRPPHISHYRGRDAFGQERLLSKSRARLLQWQRLDGRNVGDADSCPCARRPLSRRILF